MFFLSDLVLLVAFFCLFSVLLILPYVHFSSPYFSFCLVFVSVAEVHLYVKMYMCPGYLPHVSFTLGGFVFSCPGCLPRFLFVVKCRALLTLLPRNAIRVHRALWSTPVTHGICLFNLGTTSPVGACNRTAPTTRMAATISAAGGNGCDLVRMFLQEFRWHRAAGMRLA